MHLDKNQGQRFVIATNELSLIQAEIDYNMRI